MKIVGLALIAASLAGGSDDPTPYTLDIEGITLPAGETFPDNGHVNIRTTQGSFGVHFESKCITRTDAECAGERHELAQFIGKDFIPWSAFGLVDEFCVEWVQISQYNEHFGEGGQPPLCNTPDTPPEPPVDPPTEPPTEPPTTPPTTEPPVDPPVTPPTTAPPTPDGPTPTDPPATPQPPAQTPPTTAPPTAAPPAGTPDVPTSVPAGLAGEMDGQRVLLFVGLAILFMLIGGGIVLYFVCRWLGKLIDGISQR